MIFFRKIQTLKFIQLISLWLSKSFWITNFTLLWSVLQKNIYFLSDLNITEVRLQKKDETGLQTYNKIVVYVLVFRVTSTNIFITIEDPIFNTVYYSSGGLSKYFYLRKESMYGANILLGERIGYELASRSYIYLDARFIDVPNKIQKAGFIQGILSQKIYLRNISDETSPAHNGPDAKKERRKKLR